MGLSYVVGWGHGIYVRTAMRQVYRYYGVDIDWLSSVCVVGCSVAGVWGLSGQTMALDRLECSMLQ